MSGGAPLEDRPGLLAAVSRLCGSGAGVLLVAKRDRLGRDVLVSRLIEREVDRCGGRVLAVDGAGNGDEPSDRLMRTMIDAFAEHEREMIRARTKAALASKKARGERTGQVPFGFRLSADGRHVEPDEAEQRTVARVVELREEGVSIRMIARRLEEEGRRPRGKRWHARTVQRILASQSEASF